MRRATWRTKDSPLQSRRRLRSQENDKELGRAGYRFRLKAGNGEIIATSEGYTSKAGARNGIESVNKNTADAEVVDLS
ncbi:DUF1508 domain-containing protein (plasmid) [Humibacter sp. BT305]|nr:DUF1508 domain-containing protein [Humibacter sp. BT305]